MSQYWSELVNGLEPYIPGEQPKDDQLIKLNTNENPYGPSPKVLDIIRQEATDKLRLYPDPNATALKCAIATYHQICQDQVFVGNGSDEVLAHVFQGLLKQNSPLLFPDITYSFYPVYSRLYRVNYQQIPLTDKFEIDVSDYDINNGGIIIPNPNAPTGRILSLSDVEYLLINNADSVVVMDEAYIDFGGESAVSLINNYKNLLVVQTVSKSRSLAGLRVGFAMGSAELIEGLERVKNSFNSYPIDRLAIVGAVAALEDIDYFEKTRQKIIHSRNYIDAKLTALEFNVLPSKANFVFASHPRYNASHIYKALRSAGIIVRHFNMSRIDQYLRMSIGTQEECEILIKTLNDILPKLVEIKSD